MKKLLALVMGVFANNNADLIQPLTLRGAAEQACLNFNVTSEIALLSGSITWTEQ